MNPSSRRQAVIVGVVLLVGFVLFVGGILSVGSPRDMFGHKVVVHTEFADVNGLTVGSNVWFSGVKVGTVRGVKFGDGRTVDVDLALDPRSVQHIPPDVVTRISTDALLGNKIVVLSGGSQEPPIADGSVLESAESVSTEDMFAMLQQNNANLLAITSDLKGITSQVAEGQGTAGKLLSDDEIYAHLRTGVDSLVDASDSAKALTAELETFSRKLNQEGSLPNDLATDKETWAALSQSVKNLNDTTARISALAQDVDQSTKSPDSTVGTLLHDPQSAANLKTTLDNLDQSSQLLSQNLEAMQHNVLLRGYFKKQAKQQAAPELLDLHGAPVPAP